MQIVEGTSGVPEPETQRSSHLQKLPVCAPGGNAHWSIPNATSALNPESLKPEP